METASEKRIFFTKRPIAVPVNYRPMYKITEITMILKLCCRAETADLLKLHLLSWSLKTDDNLNKLTNYIKSNFQGVFSVWGMEPSLNRALQLAIADGICEMTSDKKYKLTKKGEDLYDLINDDKDLLVREKLFLKFIGKNKITDSRIKSMSQNWIIANVEN